MQDNPKSQFPLEYNRLADSVASGAPAVDWPRVTSQQDPRFLVQGPESVDSVGSDLRPLPS